MGSLVGVCFRFMMTAIGGEGYAKVPANLLTETCQKLDLHKQCKQTDEDEIYNMTGVRNPYKLPLNPESIVFIKKPDEFASYQYSLEGNR